MVIFSRPSFTCFTIVSWLVFLFLSISIFSCQSKKSSEALSPPVEWNFESDTIEINYIAAKNLNQYNNSAHTLMLNVYQLSDASDFNNYTQTTDGINRLLNLYDSDRRETIELKNVKHVQRFFVEPGTEKTVTLDRLKDVRWIGLAAGYFNALPELCSDVVQIPIQRIKKGFIIKKIIVRPADLHIQIDLGANSMHTTEVGS